MRIRAINGIIILIWSMVAWFFQQPYSMAAAGIAVLVMIGTRPTRNGD